MKIGGNGKMKRLFLILLSIIFLIGSISDATAEGRLTEKIKEIKQLSQKLNQEKGYIEDEIIVKFKPSYQKMLTSSTKIDAIEKIISKLSTLNLNVKKVKRLGPNSDFYLIKIDKEKTSLNLAINKLLMDSDIEIAEPNYIRKLYGTTPNDFYNYDLWGLTKINAPQAWDITKGSDNIVVAVIDSGIDYTHEDLAQNIWVNTREIIDNEIDDDGNGYIDDVYGIAPGYNDLVFNLSISDPMDTDGHGTHVAGIIGAVGNNGKGVVGVNWNVKILSCSALNPFLGVQLLSSTLECYAYIGYLKDRGENIKVVNASYGGPYSYAEELSIQSNLKSKGILLVTAAGNESTNNDTSPRYPCNYNLDNIICVASTDRFDNLSYFSNYGNTVHVAAPGQDIYSTYPITPENFDSLYFDKVFFDDFESGIGNWIFSSPLSGLSTNYYYSPTNSLTDSVSGNYPNDDIIIILSRKINLLPHRNYKTWAQFYVKPYLHDNDIGSVLLGINDLDKTYIPFVANGALLKAMGQYGNWFPLPFYIPKEFRKSDFQIILGLLSDNDGITDDGIYWDNIGIYYNHTQSSFYQSLQGTSMATPFVTGLAALIWSKEPTLNYLEVKNRILSSVDVIPQLSGKVATSGRINAYRALGGSCDQPFTDISCDHWAYEAVLWAKNNGITRGCNPPTNDRYCPENDVTRAQMAAFIIRALEGEPAPGSYSSNPYFSDVPPTHWAFKYVQRIRERGIATGYPGTTLYGVEDNVTREQMAKMLIMALVSEGRETLPPDNYCTGGSPFTDVDVNSWSCRFIKRLKELGITRGCNPPTNDRYCPENYVTRAQMAVFLWRAFGGGR